MDRFLQLLEVAMPMIGAPHLTTANDTTIAWAEMGSGPPLVLLHGLADSHRAWRMVAPRLATRFRVFMVDLPGHGLSARPEAPYTLPWYTDTVVQWMDTIGLERAHVCGHSYGGGIAQWMLLEHRRRVDRLALVAAGGLGREVATALRLATLPVAAPFVESPLFGAFTGLVARWTRRSAASGDSEEFARLAWMNSAPNSGLAFRRTVSGCIDLRGQHQQTWHHIHEIDSLPPIALFWGDRDPILPVEHAHDAARRLGNVTVNVYPDCGHSPHLEAAVRFTEDLAGFLVDRERACARLLPVHGEPRVASTGTRSPASLQPARAA